MHSTAVSLRFAPSGCRVSLREPTGRDERQVSGTSTRDAIQLIDAVLAPPEDEVPSFRAEDLVAADRDRILADLYRHAFGDRIESTLRCEACGNPFDIDFSLEGVTAAAQPRPSNGKYAGVGANVFEAAAGWRFRIPTGREECAIAALESGAREKALFDACLVGGEPTPDTAELQAALEEVAPLLEFDLKACCPECQQVHIIQFDIQSYLLRSLLNEQNRRIFETHCLAAAYGWSLDEILSLTRSERRKMVEIVENESARRGTHR